MTTPPDSAMRAEIARHRHIDPDQANLVATPPTAALTDVEQRILALLSQRKTNQEIAGELYMSKRSLEYHLTGIFKKLGVRRKSDLLRDADPLGIKLPLNFPKL